MGPRKAYVIPLAIFLISATLIVLVPDSAAEPPAVPFAYQVLAFSPSNVSWTAWANGTGSIAATDRDKVITSLPAAPSGDTDYSIALIADNATYESDNASDIRVAKAPSVRLWVAQGELRAGSTFAREQASHPFEYDMLAQGTASFDIPFSYVINARGVERFWHYVYDNYSQFFAFRQRTFYHDVEEIACLRNASYQLLDYQIIPLDDEGYIHETRTKLWPEDVPEEFRKCVFFVAHVHGAGLGEKHHFDVEVRLFSRANVTAERSWSHVQAGSSSIRNSDGLRLIDTYGGILGTGLPDMLELVYWVFSTAVNDSRVIVVQDEAHFHAFTASTIPYSAHATGSSNISKADGVKLIDSDPDVAPNDDTLYSVTVTISDPTATTYADTNGDGVVEAGLFYAWMDDVGGNVLFASVTTRPPRAVIESVTPAVSQSGDVVAFSGRGEDPGGGNITNHTWSSHADGLLSYSPSFNTSDLTSRIHVITLTVTNEAGLRSPPASVQVRVNQRPKAVISHAAGTGIDSSGRRVAGFGSVVTFVGVGVDFDGVIQKLEWTSSLDGFLSNSSVFSTSSLRLGEHLISLSVMDSDGARSDSSIKILVRRHPVLLVHGYLASPSIWNEMEDRFEADGYEIFTLDLRRSSIFRGSFGLPIIPNVNFTPLQDFGYHPFFQDVHLFDLSVQLPSPQIPLDVIGIFIKFVVALATIKDPKLLENGTELDIPIGPFDVVKEDHFQAKIGVKLKLKNLRINLETLTIRAGVFLDFRVDIRVNTSFAFDPGNRKIDFGSKRFDNESVEGDFGVSLSDIYSANPKFTVGIRLGFPFFRLNLANGRITDYATDLLEKLEEIRSLTGLRKVDVVAHDMGGLVARWYTLFTKDNAIRKLVLIGTPNHGTDFWKGVKWAIEKLIDWVFGKLGKLIPVLFDIIKDLLLQALEFIAGPALSMMAPHSDFLIALNGNNKDGTRCINVASRTACDILLKGGPDLVPFETQHLVILGRSTVPFLGRLDEFTISHVHVCVDLLVTVKCFEVPWFANGDWIVTDKSARLDNVPFVEFDHWHFGLLESKSVYESAREFLEDDPPIVNSEPSSSAEVSSIPELLASERLPIIEGFVDQNETNEHAFSMEPGASNFTVSLTVRDGEVDLALVDPGGKLIVPSSADGIAIRYSKSDGFVAYQIQEPASGVWRMLVKGVVDSRYLAAIEFKTNVALSLSLDKTNFDPTEGVPLLVSFRDGVSPVIGGTVQASVVDPTNATSQLMLHDDGAHGDANASDGIYGDTFTGTRVEGLYHVNVTGRLVKSGVVLERRIETSFAVRAIPDLTLASSEILLSSPSPRHEECVTITGRIRNLGTGDARDAEVQFFDGRAELGGTLISSIKVLVLAASSANATAAWCAKEGDREIFVRVNPFGELPESNYSNNEGSVILRVRGSPPRADAGRDIVATVGDPVFFDGTGSSDDGGIAEYSWDVDLSFDSDGDGVLYNDRDLSGSLAVYEPGFPSPGRYMARLNVEDHTGKRAGDAVIVRVVRARDILPPLADAASDLVVSAGRAVVLDGSSSRDNFGISSFSWDIDTAVDSDGDGIPNNDQDFVGRVVVLSNGYQIPGSYMARLTVNDVAGNGPSVDTVTIVAIEGGDLSIPCRIDTFGQWTESLGTLCRARAEAVLRGDQEAVLGLDRAMNVFARSQSVRSMVGVAVATAPLVVDKHVFPSKTDLTIGWDRTVPQALVLKFENGTENISIPIADGSKPQLLFEGELWVPVSDKCYREHQIVRLHVHGEGLRMIMLEVRYFEVKRDFEVWFDSRFIAAFHFAFTERSLWQDGNRINETRGNEVFEALNATAHQLTDLLELTCLGYTSLSFDLTWVENETVDIRAFRGNRLLGEFLGLSDGSAFSVGGLHDPEDLAPPWLELRFYEPGRRSVIEVVTVDVSCAEILEPGMTFGNLNVVDVIPVFDGGLPSEETRLVLSVLNRIVSVSELLARRAIEEASSLPLANGSLFSLILENLTLAEGALREANLAWASTKFDEAVAWFGRAWAFAIEAKRLALQS